MPRVDTEFADVVTQALEMAGWSVAEAARRSGVGRTNLEEGKNANRLFAPRDIKALILALVEAGETRAAALIAREFTPEGSLVRFEVRDRHNDLATFRDEMEQTDILWRAVMLCLEDDGEIDLHEVGIIERFAHLACGMILDQCAAARERAAERAAGVRPCRGVVRYPVRT